MRKVFIVALAIACLNLTGCAFFRVHRIDIQQGNVITEQMVNQLKPGMSMQHVKAQLGTPILVVPFRTDRLYYVYTNKPGYGKLQRNKLTIYFKNNKLTRFTTDVLPKPKFN